VVAFPKKMNFLKVSKVSSLCLFDKVCLHTKVKLGVEQCNYDTPVPNSQRTYSASFRKISRLILPGKIIGIYCE